MVTPARSSPVSSSPPVFSASRLPARPLPGGTQPTGFAPKPHVRGRKAAAPSEAAPLGWPRAPLGAPSAAAPPRAPRAGTASRGARSPSPGRPGRPAHPQGAPATPARSPPSPPARPPVTYACAGPAARRPRDKGCAAAAPPAAPGAAAAGDREEDGAEETGREGAVWEGTAWEGPARLGPPAAAAQTRALLPRPPPSRVLGRKPPPRGRGTAPRGARERKRREGDGGGGRERAFLLPNHDPLHPPPRPQQASEKARLCLTWATLETLPPTHLLPPRAALPRMDVRPFHGEQSRAWEVKCAKARRQEGLPREEGPGRQTHLLPVSLPEAWHLADRQGCRVGAAHSLSGRSNFCLAPRFTSCYEQ